MEFERPGDMVPGQTRFTEMMIDIVRDYAKLLEGEMMDNRIVWVILTSGRQFIGHRLCRLIKAAAPCWQGELVVPLWRWTLVIGWNGREPADSLKEVDWPRPDNAA